MGEKEPLSDKDTSHGICQECLEVELKQIDREEEKGNDYEND
jgi:hypothetical protein